MSSARRFLPLCLLLLAGCVEPPPHPVKAPPGKVLTGIDVLEAGGFQELRGRRIGLITNHTGRDSQGRATAEVLAGAPGVTLVAIFSPEHGFNGVVEDAKVSSTSVSLAGRDIPVYSLYAGGLAGMRPKPEDLRGIDTLVFDIQDIGARFYTYLATMGMAMEEAAKAHVAFIVLDRPDPINGSVVEGPMLTDLELPKLSPTSYFPVPVRHGLTAGEMAQLHNEKAHVAHLHVVRMLGWKRGMWYDQTGLPWVATSPNMPDLAAATLYPGLGLFEASNLAVGRGTPHPFGWVGAPWLDSKRAARRLSDALLDGVTFTAQDYTPTKSVYEGELCHGILITITDRETLRPLALFRHLEQTLTELHGQDFQWKWEEVRKMTGSGEFQRICERGHDRIKIMELFNRGAERFEKSRRPYLLY
ncbi:MAG: DUF1343 domain-containing protein [Elusimicrobia bacterium]|nr:DUF1343 domain-containing protein [Elusimicrobiota bacterium]